METTCKALGKRGTMLRKHIFPVLFLDQGWARKHLRTVEIRHLPFRTSKDWFVWPRAVGNNVSLVGKLRNNVSKTKIEKKQFFRFRKNGSTSGQTEKHSRKHRKPQMLPRHFLVCLVPHRLIIRLRPSVTPNWSQWPILFSPINSAAHPAKH